MQFYANQQMRLLALNIIPAIDSVKIVQLFGQSASVSVSKNIYIYFNLFMAQRFFFQTSLCLLGY